MLKQIDVIPGITQYTKTAGSEIEEFINSKFTKCEVIADDGATGNKLYQRYARANKRLGLPVKVMYRQQRVFLAKK